MSFTIRLLNPSQLTQVELYHSGFASSNQSETKKRSLSKPLRKSVTTSGGVLVGRTIAGTVGNKWGFSVSSRARTVWAAKPRVPQPDTGRPICSTVERVRGSFLYLLSVHTERRKYLIIQLEKVELYHFSYFCFFCSQFFVRIKTISYICGREAMNYSYSVPPPLRRGWGRFPFVFEGPLPWHKK